ncbi:MAG: rod shape-determining protein MreC [Anaerolineales bacterium]
MRQLFSRTFQVTTLFLIISGILALAFGGYLRPLSTWISMAWVSTQTWVSSRYLAIQQFVSAPQDIAALRQRNAELEAQISQLQSQVIELQQQLTDREILAALVRYSRANPTNTYKAAQVIGRDPSPFMHYIIINVGSNDGVRRGMPVVTHQGLVGRVDAVIDSAARVQLITDPTSNVNVRIQNSQTDAVLVGSLTADLTLEMIPQNAQVIPGDLVLTSGLGGVYPPNIPVGQVVDVRKREAELFQQASIQPSVDFAQLSIVLVILNFTPIDVSPLIPTVTP